MKRPLIFVGSRVMLGELATIADLNNIEILGILDCHYYGNTDTICGIPIIGDERWLLNDDPRGKIYRETCDFFPGNYHDGEQRSAAHNTNTDLNIMHNLSSPDLRRKRIDILDKSKVNVINLIHPDASVAGLKSKYSSYKIGKGVQIHYGCFHGVDNVVIEDYTAFLTGNIIGHAVKVGRNTLVAPQTFLHDCDIGADSVVGIYSRINTIPKKKKLICIGKNVTIWHSSEVTDDIPDSHIHTSDGRRLKKLKG
jgi:UDP-3-O-[3-hydroxymyristoyl] glucosamine N-acyltransferase